MLTLKEVKKEKLDHLFYLTMGYADEDFEEKKNGTLVIVKFDIVANQRMYQKDRLINEDLKGFLSVNAKHSFRTEEEAKIEKCQRQTS